MFRTFRPLAVLLLALVLAPAAWAQEKDKTEKAAAKPPAAEKATVAVFRMRGSLLETPTNEDFSFSTEPSTVLKDVVARLKKAAEDKTVQAVLLTADDASIGPAQIEELRQGIAALRSAGKEVYAHSDSMQTLTYVLLSGASRLSMSPTADLWLTGLYGEQPYLNGMLKKLGVKADFLTCGAYKSAAEMFTREGPSKEADEMQNWLLDGLFAAQVKLIAEGRGVGQDKAKQWIDGGPYTAEKALAAGLIDAVEHRQAVLQRIKEKYGQDTKFDTQYGKKKSQVPDLSSPLAVLQIWGELLSGPKKKVHKTSVAVVYVDGPIMLGSGTASLFGGVEGAFSSDLRKALDKAASDDTIKAVVLRVNSPGGSATASEIILDATKRVKAKKPLVVSMGDVAGSGGYYVACGSDVIFADESTITGSIGVVGGKMATTEMWNKVGINWKGYQRGANAGLLSSASVFSDSERKRMQEWMDEVYGVFKGHVQAIRGAKLKKDLDDLAGGRVYTGRQALELGLVDKIGTLEDAVQHVAGQAGISDYEIRVVPEPKSFIEMLLEDSSSKADEPLAIGMGRLGSTASGSPLLDAALPLLQGLDPQRVRAIQRSLVQLHTLRHEGAVLAMPEILWRQ
jgi:protease-4